MTRQIREKAADTLWLAEKRGRYVDDILAKVYPRGLKASRRALLTEIVLGTVRRRGTLDFILGRYRPLKDIKPRLLWILRVALYQMGFLSRVPDRVAVDAAVDQAKATFGAGGGKLANALLRRVQRDWLRQPVPSGGEDPRRDVLCSRTEVWRGPDGAFPDPAAGLGANLAPRFSMPEWIVARWIESHGRDAAMRLIDVQNSRPGIHCWVDPAAGEIEAVQTEFLCEGIGAVTTPFGLRTTRGASKIIASRAFRTGKVLIQDETSASVVPFLGVQKGDRVLEVGAAPGGKTVALARAVGSEGRVVALDRSRSRLELLSENLERFRLLDRVDTVVGDGTRLPGDFRGTCDRVLLDVPCSNTGVLARRPEARWRLTPGAIQSLAAIQKAMLAEGLNALRPGTGLLVYSTCSIEREENQAVLASGRARGVVDAEELVFPDDNRDGGYKARLRKK